MKSNELGRRPQQIRFNCMNARTGEIRLVSVEPGVALGKVRRQLLGRDVVFRANRIKLYRAKDLETGEWIEYSGNERMALLLDSEVHPRLRAMLNQPALNCELPVDHADTLGEDLASAASERVVHVLYQYPWRCFLLRVWDALTCKMTGYERDDFYDRVRMYERAVGDV